MIIFGEKLFTNPLKTIVAFNLSQVKSAFDEIEQLKNKFYVVGYLRYNAFSEQKYDFPLLYFEVFNSYDIYKTQNTKKLLLNPISCVNFYEYSQAIKKIKQEIADGNTYEVNYTYDFNVPYDGDDYELFECLLNKQKTPYNFYIKNNTVVIYFGLYEIAPYASGISEFIISNNLFEGNLKYGKM